MILTIHPPQPPSAKKKSLWILIIQPPFPKRAFLNQSLANKQISGGLRGTASKSLWSNTSLRKKTQATRHDPPISGGTLKTTIVFRQHLIKTMAQLRLWPIFLAPISPYSKNRIKNSREKFSPNSSTLTVPVVTPLLLRELWSYCHLWSRHEREIHQSERDNPN
jgi:hypothetical protein